MNDPAAADPAGIDRLYQKLAREAAAGGYFLNPDNAFTRELIAGLLVNERRYGYPACPCRLASGIRAEDLDIICPCDYRDPDLAQFGTCYCGLYVTKAVAEQGGQVRSIPERRPPPEARSRAGPTPGTVANLPFPVWRCKVCGYLCARPEPPDVCPVCKVTKDRFERFM